MSNIFRRMMLLIVVTVPIGFFSTSVSAFTVQTGEKDGLTLSFTSEGAVKEIVTLKGNLVFSSPSGFFVWDVATGKDIKLKRTVQNQDNGTLLYKAYEPDPENNSNPVNINLEAIFTGYPNRIEADIYIKNLTSNNRALTIYFALAINMQGWTWGDDIRIFKPIKGNVEISNTVDVGFGSNGKISRYPIAAIYGDDGIAIGYRLDYPAAIRLVANPITNQLKIAFDVALLPCTESTCSGKHVLEHLKAVIYRFDPEWGFRSAIQKYYEIYPEFFVKRVTKEGIWVFHPQFLHHIPDIEDFGIAFHTYGIRSLSFEDKHSINSLRYLSEPWSFYRETPAYISWNTEQKAWDYEQVMSYLYSLYKTSHNKDEKEQAETTLSSGAYAITSDTTGNKKYKYNFFSVPETKNNGEPTWCPRCANFIHNSDPDIKDPVYHLNKAHYEWNDEAKSIYQNTASGVLDGEFIDTIETGFQALDYRESHFDASDLPLIYNSNLLPAVPITFSTYEFSRWVRTDILRKNKLLMSNGLRTFAFFAHLFDVMGIEVGDWLFKPDKDSDFNFWRTMSYQKPFTFLVYDPNLTHNDSVRRPIVERYFKTSLFYGIYPGMAATDDTFKKPYFKDAVIYEKDRDLFKKYIPLIQTLGAAGWQPVTYVKSSNSNIYVERYGPKPSASIWYITIRNISTERQTYFLALTSVPLGLTNILSADLIDILTGDTVTATRAKADETYLTLKDTIEANEVRMFAMKKDVCTDNDNDGYAIEGGICGHKDCDDNNPSINPAGIEVCNDRIDNNCNGETDEGSQTYYIDNDGDGYGDINRSIRTCHASPPAGYVADNTDCNDSDAMVNPHSKEVPGNDKDDDCNITTSDNLFISNWYHTNWQYRQKITIEKNITTEVLNHFPVLIRITDVRNPVFGKAKSNGSDIIFTSSDGKTLLPHEIEHYQDTDPKELDVWVKVPVISPTNDTVIYMYYGYNNANNQDDPASVWDSNYKGVWHLSETTGGMRAIKDSTVNKNHGTDKNNPILGAAGQIHKAIYLEGFNYIDIASSANLSIKGPITVEAWVYPTALSALMRIIHSDGQYILQAKTDNSIAFADHQDNSFASEDNVLTRNKWNHIAVVFSGTKGSGINVGSNAKIYIDGSQKTASGTLHWMPASAVKAVNIGRGTGDGYYFKGLIDEVRISNVARSDAWIKVSYNNQSAPASYLIFGLVEYTH